MKAIFIFFAIVLSFTAKAINTDSVWIRENYLKKEVYITMRDGVRLFTSIYMPKDISSTHPFLIWRTPYSCEPYGADQWEKVWESYRTTYFRENYIMVKQDVRGRWMSEGEFKDVRPFIANKKGKQTDEASDSYDTIEWLLKNIPHNNGKAGVYGISYPGFYSTMAAASNHPALKAVSPQSPVTNWFIGDDFHHNGAFFQMDAFDFYSSLGSGFGVAHPKPVNTAAVSVGYPIHDNYKFYLETGTLKNLTKYTGDSIAFWKDLMAHPNYDEWWQSRDARLATKNLQPAMLWVGGLFDAEDCWGAWNAYKAAEENNPGKPFNKIVEGPWFHDQWSFSDGTFHGNIKFGSNTSEYYQQHFEIPFFNYFLKGKGDISQIAEANVFITGANEWRAFSQWPPSGKADKTMYLHANGKLSDEKPIAANSFSEYVSDPARPVPYDEDVHFNRTRNYMSNDQRFASRRPDVLVFQTDTLSSAIIVTGSMIADIAAGISTTDADFVVKIIDVFPDHMGYNKVDVYSQQDTLYPYPMGGYQMLVRAEIFRGKYRNSYTAPSPFTPGKIEHIKFELPAIAHSFKPGHRIMVQVQSSWFPLADRNPQQFIDIYHCDEKDFIKSNIKIYHDDQHASSIVFPVLK